MTLERMIAAIRANLAAGAPAARGVVAPERGEDAARLEADQAALFTAGDLASASLGSARRLGTAVLGARRVLLRLLGPVLARQSAYNAANARVIAALRRDVETLTSRVTALSAALEDHERRARQAATGPSEDA